MGEMFADFASSGIDLTNRHPGTRKTRCPRCSDIRKNFHEHCLSVTFHTPQDVVWKCHNCDWTGGTIRRETPMTQPVVTVRPNITPSEPTPELLAWFQARGIEEAIVRRMRIFQTTRVFNGRSQKAIAFPYYRDNVLVSVKYRSLEEKAFTTEANCEQAFYNVDALKNCDEVFVVEGECFPGNAEILTMHGWVRFDAYDGKLPVLQVDGDLRANFVRPIAAIRKHYTGDLIRHERGGNYVSVTTPKHNLVVQHAKSGRLYKRTADDPTTSPDTIPCTVHLDGPGIQLTNDQIALALAVQADSAVRPVKDGRRYAVFGLKKQRKIDRLRGLLERCGIKASDNPLKSRQLGYQSICFHLPDWVPGKTLPMEWVALASLEQREFILAEMVEWDGNRVPNRNQTEYSCNRYENVTWMQAIAHTSGRMSTIIPRKNTHGTWFKASILYGKKSVSRQKQNPTTIQHDGDVYCVTVPTGMILVRQEGKIAVTGNCDALSMMQAGFDNVISVPRGAPQRISDGVPPPEEDTNFRYLWPAYDALRRKKRVILATDSDDPGHALAEELARRIGKDKCWRVSWPDGYGGQCKDANETLTMQGSGSIASTCLQAAPWPINGIYESNAFFDQTIQLYRSGRSKGYSTGWAELDEYMTIRPGEVSIVTGVPNHGKSAFIDALTHNLAQSLGWKFGICSFENPPDEHLSKLAEIHDGRPFREGPTIRMTEAELRRALHWVDRHYYFIRLDEDEAPSLDTILEKARGLVARYGISGFVLDPWGELDNGRAKFVNETSHIAQCLTKIRQFARNHAVHVWVVAHPAKMQRENGKTPAPNLYDISGSASFFNKADIGIVIHRPEPKSAINGSAVDIIVEKVRFRAVGKQGTLRMKFNNINGRYFVPEPEDEPPPRSYDKDHDGDTLH